MISLLCPLVASLLAAVYALAAQADPSCGHGRGAIEFSRQSLEFRLDHRTDDQCGRVGEFDIPLRESAGSPLADVEVELTSITSALAGFSSKPFFPGAPSGEGLVHSGESLREGVALPLALRQRGDSSGSAFPKADPESVGIPSRALELLASHVQSLVKGEDIVGAELAVIKNRRSVLHRAFGWKDREAGQPLEVGSIYCVRSMTKPLVGTAIQMLIDDGRLRLDTPVRQILPFFDGARTSTVTVEHLLTHTGGFPFTTMARPLSEYADLDAVAAEAAAVEPEFEPGEGFLYSDAGSDILGAIVARITGAPVEQFIQRRILDPLGMRDTLTLLKDGHESLARIPSAYSGGTGSWSRHWKPSDPPIFPLFLTSQSLYSTTTDYARFLTLWMDGGRAGEQRLLSPEAVRRALQPGQRINASVQGFAGLDRYYGQQWVVFAKPDVEAKPQRVLFGHDGSDGTHAWAWPELDLMVLFFTQSRGTTAGIALEGLLQRWLVEQALDDHSPLSRAPSPQELEPLTGIYWDEMVDHAYYVVSALRSRLVVDRPGRVRLIFKPGESPGRYVHDTGSQVRIDFIRSQDGAATALRTSFGGQVRTNPRHRPQQGLPSVASVIASVKRAHRIDLLSQLGPVRLSGAVKLETRRMQGRLATLFDASRQRTEIRIGAAEEVVATAGGRAWTSSTSHGVTALDGQRLEQALLDRFSVRFGDWSEHYQAVEVLKRVRLGNDVVLLVRAVPLNAPGWTMFVHEESGLVVHVEGLTLVPGIGVVGLRTRYGDFREVGGMRLPFRIVDSYASSLLGRVVTTWEKAETRVEIPQAAFTRPKAANK